MKTVDLSGYNLAELKDLQQNVDREVGLRQQQELQSAREKILAIAQQAGISVEELFATAAKKQKGGQGQKVKPQYHNPEDKSQTWTGRGRQPRWVAEGIAQGKTLNDFRM